MWFFNQDNEVQSWRLIGIAGRMCLELGMHRKAGIEKAFPSPDERKWALALFWSVYSFDRRWCLGTGLPFSIPDADIDPFLPTPVSIPESTLLQTLTWCQESGYPRAIYGCK